MTTANRERAQELAQKVTFGIVTALPHEFAAMKAMLRKPVAGEGAHRDYMFGEIAARGGGCHAIALAMGGQGNAAASACGTALATHFPSLQVLLMVGIAGGVPHPTKVDAHVRLGDIVVVGEHGVVKYDFVKEHAAKVEPRHPPRPPVAILVNASGRLAAYEHESKRPWEQHVKKAQRLKFGRPAADLDVLHDTQSPDVVIPHPADDQRRDGQPRVFFGTIGAADALQKNPSRRDYLRDTYQVRAIEMEGFGVAEAAHQASIGYFIVRGICDYCDRSKGDAWQKYAALVAAAYTRALLEEAPPLHPRNNEKNRSEVSRSPLDAVRVHEGNVAIEAEHGALLDRARDRIRAGRIQIALEDLLDFETRAWTAASPPVRGRILTLLGSAYFQLGEVDKASDAFIRAVSAFDKDARNCANAAFAYSLRDDVNAAIHWAKKALEIDSTDLTARQVLILHDDRNHDVIKAEHEGVVGRRAEIYFALAHRAIAAGDRILAASMFIAAANHDSSNMQVIAAAGQALLEELPNVQSEVEELFPEVRESLEKAIMFLRNAWESLQEDPVRRANIHWLVSLTMALRLGGSRAEAKETAEKAYSLAPRHTEVRRMRAAIASDEGDWQRVIELLADAGDVDVNALGMLATAYASAREFQRAIPIWCDLLTKDLDVGIWEQVQRNYLLTLCNAGRKHDVQQATSAMLAVHKTLRAYLIAWEASAGDAAKAERDEFLESAFRAERRGASRRDVIDLGDALMAASRFADALRVYESCIPRPESNERDAQRVILSAYRARSFARALEVCRKVSAVQVGNRLPAEVESAICEELGDLQRAERVCRRYLGNVPDDPDLVLRLALILLREGSNREAAAVALRLPKAAFQSRFELGSRHAAILAEAGERAAALDALYSLRRRYNTEARAHSNYVMRFHHLHPEDISPTVLAPGTAALLRGDGAPPDWVLLLEEGEEPLAHDEYRPSHDTACALVGKQVGDRVLFEAAPDRVWEVAEIASKYAFAFRQSLTLFEARFPTDRSIRQFTLPSDPAEMLQKIREVLEAVNGSRLAAQEVYATSFVTVGAVEAARRERPSKALAMLLAAGTGLIACENSVAEKQTALRLLDDLKRPLVADYSAIMLLDGVGILPEAVKDRTVIVAQTTIDAFRREHAYWSSIATVSETRSLGFENGELVGQVLRPDEVQGACGRLANLLAWLTGTCTVTAVSSAVLEQHADKHALAASLGQHWYDSLLLAAEPGRTLLSDDLRLREIGRSLFGTQGVASVHLLVHERGAGRLDTGKCAQALVRLHLWGYRHVGTDATMLEAAATMAGDAFERTVHTLRGPDAEERSSVLVAAFFFRVISLGLTFAPRRDALFANVIDALCSGRSRRDVLQMLRQAIAATCHLLPTVRADAERVIRSWERTHVLT